MARLTRREILKRFGLTAGSLPLLDALGRKAWAGGPDGGTDAGTYTPPPKRLVCIFIGHGIFAQNWVPFQPSTMPIGTDSPGSMLKAAKDYLRPVAFQQGQNCKIIDLDPFTGALSPIFSAKWQGLKAKTAFIHNLGCSNDLIQGHTNTATLGGYKNADTITGVPYGTVFTGETIDVVVGRKLNGQDPLVLKAPDTVDDVRFLQDAFSPSVHKTATGYEFVPSFRDPRSVWDRLFSGYMPPVTGPKKRDPTDRRIALLDRTLSRISTIKTDSRLSGYDKQRLETHSGFLEGQRTHLQSMSSIPMVNPVVPPQRVNDKGISDTGDTFAVAKAKLVRATYQNASAAIKMNKAQVVTIDAGLENGWVTEGIALDGNYHGQGGHLANPSDANIEAIRQVQQLHFDAIADFLLDLDVLEDPVSGATYLDNTLVMIGTEHDGRPNGHLRAGLKSVLIGGFGTFKTGRIYDFSNPAWWNRENYDLTTGVYPGFSYGRLLRTVQDSFQLTAAEKAQMDIQAIYHDWWQTADITDADKPLPGLT